MANPAQHVERMTTTFGKTDISLVVVALAAGALPTSGSGYIEFNQNILPTSARAGTGLYDFFLKEPWRGLLGWSFRVLQAAYSASGACYGDVTIDNVASATPKVRVTFRTAAGAAVDLAVGDTVYGSLDLKWKKN